jgi:hypothetical protein
MEMKLFVARWIGLNRTPEVKTAAKSGFDVIW